ncbi:hypothetical protein ACJW30_12G076100 [Castanea mollissima]
MFGSRESITTFEKVVFQSGMVIAARVFELLEEFFGGQIRELIFFLEIEHVETTSSSSRRALHCDREELGFSNSVKLDSVSEEHLGFRRIAEIAKEREIGEFGGS